MSSKKTKVLFCTDGVFPHAIGGMQRHSALLAEALAATGKIELIVVHPHKEKVFTAIPNITEIALDFNFITGTYIRRLREYSKLIYNIAKEHPDAIIYSQGYSAFYGIKEIGNRVIVNPHGLEPFQAISFRDKAITTPFRLMSRRQFKYAAKIVSLGGRLTEILQHEIPGNANKKIAVLPNAVNPGEMPKRDFTKNNLNLLFVGRFAFNKGINVLCEAIRQLNVEGYKNKLTFNLVGKGPLYEKYIKEYDFENINFIGFADDDKLTQLYIENDLFVFPTLFEGMPTVVLEAMAVGMPVIVSDTGATAELVDSSNGYLIEKDNIRSLRWAIHSYYQLNEEQRLRLSEKSREKVMERFTWSKVADQHIELFENLRSVL